MKLETEYLGMSKLFKYAIKSYFKNITLCGMPRNILQHVRQLHILLPSVAFVTHYTPLCWPGLFFCRWYSFWKMPFNKSRHFFVCSIMALKLSLHSEPITSPTVKSFRATWVIIVTTTSMIRSCKLSSKGFNLILKQGFLYANIEQTAASN